MREYAWLLLTCNVVIAFVYLGMSLKDYQSAYFIHKATVKTEHLFSLYITVRHVYVCTVCLLLSTPRDMRLCCDYRVYAHCALTRR